MPQVLGQVKISLPALAQVESAGNPRADSFLGAKFGRGLYQISDVALEDYLAYHPTRFFAFSDLYKPDVCKEVALWLLTVRIPQLIRHHGKEVTLENVLTAYNMGHVAVKRGVVAERYIAKYKEALLHV